MSVVKLAILLITFDLLAFYESAAKLQPVEIKACGTPLAEILSSVCGGMYNGKKRSNTIDNAIPDSDDGYGLDTYGEYESTNNLFRSKRNAFSLLQSMRSKRKQGLVEECCLKSCALDELRGYCAL